MEEWYGHTHTHTHRGLNTKTHRWFGCFVLTFDPLEKNKKKNKTSRQKWEGFKHHLHLSQVITVYSINMCKYHTFLSDVGDIFKPEIRIFLFQGRELGPHLFLTSLNLLVWRDLLHLRVGQDVGSKRPVNQSHSWTPGLESKASSVAEPRTLCSQVSILHTGHCSINILAQILMFLHPLLLGAEALMKKVKLRLKRRWRASGEAVWWRRSPFRQTHTCLFVSKPEAFENVEKLSEQILQNHIWVC